MHEHVLWLFSQNKKNYFRAKWPSGVINILLSKVMSNIYLKVT